MLYESFGLLELLNHVLEKVQRRASRTTLKQIQLISRVQMKSWAGKALETVNCCAFLKRRLIGAC
jgi:hypothetical protein